MAEAVERLTWAEIRDKYPDEWVMMAAVEWLDEDSLEFRSALVIGHAKDRHAVYAATEHLAERFPDGGCFFTGKVVEKPSSVLLFR